MIDNTPANQQAMIALDAVRFAYPGGQDFAFDLAVVTGERVAVIGPMVEPQGMLLRLTNTCHGTPAASNTRWAIAADPAEVA